MLSGNEIVLPVRKWYKVAKRIIEIIAPSGLHLDKKRDRSVSAAVFLCDYRILTIICYKRIYNERDIYN